MKKFLTLLLGVALSISSADALSLITFSRQYIKEKPGGHGSTKSPVMAPEVYIDENVLYFAESHPAYTLSIVDESGDTVFSTTIGSETTEIALPTTLSGEYSIELVMGNWLFTGTIYI